MDVAKRAGVGRRTVSNVVIGFPHVSEEVRVRVLRAIDELGYVPNRAAQHLRTGRSGIIALTVPELGVGYFGELANLIIEEAAARGAGTIVAQTHGARARELAEIERLLALQPDGLITSPLGLTSHDIDSITQRTNVGIIGEHFAGDAIAATAIDNAAAASDVVAHLLDTGRRRVAFIGGAGVPPRFDALRRAGYLSAIAAHGIDPITDITVSDFTSSAGLEAGGRVAARIASGGSIDAVFCVTDEVAIGVIRGLHDADVRVPSDVAVAGFDDVPEGRYSTPRLTTVSPDKKAIARRAVDAALGGTGSTDAIGYSLAVRESTAVSPPA